MTDLRRSLVGVLTAALLAGAGILPAAAQGDLKNAITVRGAGIVTLKPDQAELAAGVVTHHASAAKALGLNSTAVRQLFKLLSEYGVPTGDVQTVRFIVTPQYRNRDKRKPGRIVGYQVTNEIAITVRDLDLLGVLLDDLVKRSANQINGIRFSVTGADQLADEARQKAIADAKRKAGIIAKAAGVRVGRVIRIHVDPIRGTVPSLGFARVQGGAVPIAPGEQRVNASVTVTYAID